MNTRSRLRPECLTFLKETYIPAECGGALKNKNIEFIAQARFLYKMNQLMPYGSRSAAGISPDLQWEVKTTSGPRPDVVYYNHLDSAKPAKVQLIELKNYKRREGVVGQLTAQIAAFPKPSLAVSAVEEGDIYRTLTGSEYSDSFKLWLGQCQDGTDLVQPYKVWSDPNPEGVVYFDRDGDADCDNHDGEDEDNEEYLEEEQDSVEEPAPIDAPTQDQEEEGDSTPVNPEYGSSWTDYLDCGPCITSSEVMAQVVDELTGVWRWEYLTAKDFIRAVDCWGSVSNLRAYAKKVHDGRCNRSPNTFGEPHFITLDGLAYDMQSIGEFEYLNAPEFDVQVQARFIRALSANASIVNRVAFDLAGFRTELDNDGIRVAGKRVDVPDGGYLYFGDGAAIFRDEDYYMVVWPGRTARPTLVMHHSRISVSIPSGAVTSGLLGNNDGIASNDLALRSGEPVDATDAEEIHGAYANSWRIDQQDSLFTYGAGETTDDYTDLAFPANIDKIADFNDAAIAAATGDCIEAGVPEGALFRACVLDLLLTGDESFAQDAADSVQPVIDPNAAVVDGQGNIAVDFTDPIPPNFTPIRTSSDATLGRFAGPMFDHDNGYAFDAGNLPPHVGAEVTFDLIAVGDWNDDNVEQSITVDLDEDTVWSDTFADTGDPHDPPEGATVGEPTQSGYLAGGTAFAVFPVTISEAHYADTLGARVTSTGTSGAQGVGYAIDNVSISLDLVAPQAFVINNPASVSNGVPTPGAGNLETLASRDVYEFTVPAGGQSIYLDMGTCSAAVNWQLVDSGSGEVLESENRTCLDKRFSTLGQGAYKLEFTPSTSTVTYSFNTFLTPPPQEFSIALPANVSNGAPSSGAGNLETKASKDVYAFSVPSGGGSLYLDMGTCSTAVTYTLFDGTTGLRLDRSLGLCMDQSFAKLPTGNYRLEFTTYNNSTATYSFTMFAAPATQTFSIATPGAVSSGSPSSGAGNLETKASTDVYEFTVPAGGQSLKLDMGTCSKPVSWELFDQSQSERIDGEAGVCRDRRLSDLPQGSYRLVFTPYGAQTATYAFTTAVVPMDTFSISTPASVSNGSPASGAGNLETTAAIDTYRFSVPADGQSIYLDMGSCSKAVSWRLVGVATNVVIDDDTGVCRDSRINDLPSGDYQLEFYVYNNQASTYAFTTFVVPDPQTFSISTPATVSNGVPSSGAGNLETKASKDVYTFTVPSGGQSIYLDMGPCSIGVSWWLYDAASDGNVVDSEAGTCADKRINSLPAGTYRFEFYVYNNQASTYAFTTFVVPDPQTYNVAVPASISNGVPATGAGNLETKASKDAYAFAVPAGGKNLRLDMGTCSSGVSWRLLAVPAETQVTSQSGTCADRTISGLAAGDYRLEFFPYNNSTATYSLSLAWLP